MNICGLCGSRSEPYVEDARRTYLQCTKCELVQVPEVFLLDAESEKKEYDKHKNTPNDEGYRRFLSRLYEPLVSQLKVGSSGLDFGCGPGPTLSCMFEEAGMSVALYDLYYQPNRRVLECQYDFVCATEVIEHFRSPAQNLQTMWACVKPGGKLGVMTKLTLSKEAFLRWHYKNDLTHIAFFSKNTLRYLEHLWKAELVAVAKDAFIFTKSV